MLALQKILDQLQRRPAKHRKGCHHVGVPTRFRELENSRFVEFTSGLHRADARLRFRVVVLVLETSLVAGIFRNSCENALDLIAAFRAG